MSELGKVDPMLIVCGSVVLVAGVLLLLKLRSSSKTPSFPPALDPTKPVQLKLIRKENISHDTRRFRFALPSSNMCLGLPVGKHFNIRATIDGKIVQRSYTPTSLDDDIGWCELVIKVYFANVHPNFPEGGKMSQYLDGLQIGDHIEVHGPKGLIEYLGHGKLVIKDLKGAVKTSATCKNIGMIAGGTGITPMFQVIKSMLKDPSDNTNVYLLFANQTADDILLSEELNEIASHPNINIWYTLDRAPADWKYSTGFINQDMLRDHMPPPGPDSIILMCGPPPMIKNACIPNLLNLSYSPDFVVAF